MSKDKISSEDYQEIDFNEENKINMSKQLNEIKINFENIMKEINKLKSDLTNINNCCKVFTKEIETYLKWLSSTTNSNETKRENTKIIKDFIQKFNVDFEKYIYIFKETYNKNYMEKFYENNERIKKVKEIIDLNFYPPKCENMNNSIKHISVLKYESQEYFNNNLENSFHERADNFYDLNENDNIINNLNDNNNNIIQTQRLQLNNIQSQENYLEDNNNNILKCSYCKINKAIYKCSTHCDKIFCEGCYKTISEFEQNSQHILQKIEENQLDNETAKELFLKNFIEFIKFYLLKCNYLLNLENPNFNFPTIENINNNDIESQKIYLNKIIEICPSNIGDNEENEENEIKINGRLVSFLENIFKNKKIHISNDNIDNDDDFYSDEHCPIIESEFDNIKDKLVYFITVVAKEKRELINEYADVIISRFSESLSISKNNVFILLNDKIDNFVKSRNFADLSYNQIGFENPVFNNFKDVKKLIDQFLCIECNISNNYFDYKGNCLNPNLSYNINRGTEIYDPPYGWKAIGLNVEDKYDNKDWLENKSNSSEWAIAYHGISQKNSEESNERIIKYIITKNGIKSSISKIKSDSNDKRNWGKVGEGIYLSPKIKTAENYTGIISFNNKKYKVLFMAKVFIKGIREPEYSNFWVLDEKYIRIYRILFKEIC